MKKGSVKFFSIDKGFGFIREEETDKEYFVHVSNVKETITENDKVEFEIAEGKKGPMAVEVKLI